MSGAQFFETRMGKTFFEATMPGLVAALKAIAEHLSRGDVIAAEEAKRQSEETFWKEAFIASLHCVPPNTIDGTGWAEGQANEALEVWRKRVAKLALKTG